MNTTALPPTPPEESRTVQVEILISHLRGGMILSLAVILLGIVLMFAAHPEYISSTETFAALADPPEARPFDLGEILDGAIHARGESVITLGFLILTMTPVLRVAVSTLVFVYQKDRVFTAITIVVLLLLLSSFLLGKAG